MAVLVALGTSANASDEYTVDIKSIETLPEIQVNSIEIQAHTVRVNFTAKDCRDDLYIIDSKTFVPSKSFTQVSFLKIQKSTRSDSNCSEEVVREVSAVSPYETSSRAKFVVLNPELAVEY